MSSPSMAGGSVPSVPPGVSAVARHAVGRLLKPIERFMAIEASSGLALLACALVALAWANSPWSASYERLWHAPITLGIGDLGTRVSLHFVVNDVLMVIFFFVVGLEIRRELHDGELADVRRAALPIAAALGGMLTPAALFLALNTSGAGQRGWGIPMATDIAFALGSLALLGKRIPSALRVLLLALAIIDDIGAILVIALFYSSGVKASGLVLAGLGIAATLVMRRIGVRHALAFVAPGIVVWLGVLRAGVHPTIAGVILGLLTPATAWFGRAGFLKTAEETLDEVRRQEREGADPDDLIAPLNVLAVARREALSPVERLQATLHGWVAFGVMPIFALANAGVHLSGVGRTADDLRLFAGILVGLVIGKPLGILAASALAVRLGIARLPRRVNYVGIAVVGCTAGVGFTMALFIAELAFGEAQPLSTAKLAVLAASLAASVLAIAVGRIALPISAEDVTIRDAERSTLD